jgi:hypothetical protein
VDTVHAAMKLMKEENKSSGRKKKGISTAAKK